MKIHNNRTYMTLLWAFLLSLLLVGCNSEDMFDGPIPTAQLERIDIFPSQTMTQGTSTFSLAAGNLQSFRVIGYYTDGFSRTLNNLRVSDWHSDDHEVAFFESAGVLAAKSPGNVTVSVTKHGITSNPVTITVTNAVITKINVTPSVNTIAKGQTQSLTAIAIYSDNTSLNISNSVIWEIVDDTTATVSSDGLLTGVNIGSTTITAFKNGMTSNTVNVTVTPAVITTITVTPAVTSIAKGQIQQLTATAIYSDGTSSNVSNSVTWAPVNRKIATVTSDGLLTGMDTGSTTITASKNSVTSNTVNVTVTPAVITTINVTPSVISFAKGQTQQLTATAIYSDKTSSDVSNSVKWSSNDRTIVTVTPEGVLTGTDMGNTTITAFKYGVTSNTVNVTVTPAVITNIVVTPSEVSLAKGISQPLNAMAIYSDNSFSNITSTATWSTTDVDIATVTPTGLVTGIEMGSTTIMAFKDGISSNTIDVTVTDAVITAITVTPSVVSVAKGQAQPLTAMATYSDGSSLNISNFVSWMSVTPATATVTPEGLLTGVDVGSTTVTAFKHGVTSNTVNVTVTPAVITDITVTPSVITIAKGQTQSLEAIAIYSDRTSSNVSSSVTWIPMSPEIATVTPLGLLTGVDVGSTTITAVKNGIISNTVNVTVTAAVITEITVTPSNFSVAKGQTQALTAIALYSNGRTSEVSNSVTWIPEESAIATVTPLGLLTGVDAGSTTITAFKDGIISNTVNVTVTEAVITAITVTPSAMSLAKGETEPLLATATYSDGTSSNVSDSVTWTSMDPATAIVAPIASLTGVEAGSTTVTAFKKGIISNTVNVTVTEAVITEINVMPSEVNVAKGQTQALTAMAIYSDGTSSNLSNKVTWVSAEMATATVTPSGLVTGVELGTTTVTAFKNGITSNTVNVTVTAAVITEIVITPSNLTIYALQSQTQPLKAIAIYSDNTSSELANSVNWLSSNTAIATVNSQGFVTGHQSGGVIITAQYVTPEGVTLSNTTNVTVISTLVTSWGHATYGGNTSAVQNELVNVTELYASEGAFAAKRSDGHIIAWGGSGYGGDNSAVQSQLTNVATIYSNRYAFAALREDGTVVTWGNATNGGNSSEVQSELTNVTTIFNNRFAFAALREDGSVVTWGRARNGGDSSAVQSQLFNVTDIYATMYAFAAVREDGNVVTWGHSSYGGDSSAVQSQLVNVTTVVGNETAFAALREDGSVVAWGHATYGGNTSAVQSELVNVTALYASEGAFAAKRSDGHIIAWGGSGYGGDNSAVQSQLTNVATVYSNRYAFAALREDGTVVTWGNATNGGNNSEVQSELIDVTTIFNNRFAFAALREDGSVVTWGRARNGGDSSAVQSQLFNVTDIYATMYAFAAVREDGNVVTWGHSSYGGDSSAVQSQLVNVTTVVGNETAFAAIRED